MKFEIISQYANAGLKLPERKTAYSAGYDFQVAEDIIVPAWSNQRDKMIHEHCIVNENLFNATCTLETIAQLTKATGAKPTLVPTGIKCEMPGDCYLELSVRSSCPLKHWLILANGVGVIDADYYNNPDNEGHIYFQLINLSPFDIQLRKGDIIGQGILKRYETVDNDAAWGERVGGFGSTDSIIDLFNSFGLPYYIDEKKVTTLENNKDNDKTFTTETYDVEYSGA